MPELPDVTLYVEALDRFLTGRTIRGIRLGSPFVLQSVEPSIEEMKEREVTGFHRIGKRVVFEFRDEVFAVIHLMIAGRFKWKKPGAALPRRAGLAAFDFDHGALFLTEAGTKKRATLHLVRGASNLTTFDRGGLDVLQADAAAFRERLLRENHTLKRSLTDPRLFDGIGNAYSDEILHRARLSPLKWTERLSDDEIERLHESTRSVLLEWIERLREQTGDGFPEKVTAFREEMAVHGKYGQSCPECGSPVQRIVYAANETNYCPGCQTDGRVLADRALSRLLKKDWPRNLDALEERFGR